MRLPSRPGMKSYIGCRFAYQVGGSAREASARPGSPIITDQQPVDFGTPRVTPAKLQGWVFRHRPGSTLTIHYDPSNPDNISLAGTDDEIKDMLPHERLLFGFLAATAGLIMILGARRMGKRLMRWNGNSRSAGRCRRRWFQMTAMTGDPGDDGDFTVKGPV